MREARQDEEGIDADEAAGRPREPEIEQEDGDDGDPAQTLEVCADLARRARRGRRRRGNRIARDRARKRPGGILTRLGA